MNGFEKSVGWSEKHSFRANHNRRQNEFRHFALNGLFDVFRTSNGEKIAFPPPSPPCNVVPLFELSLENKKHPNFEWRGQGRGVNSYVSEVTLFEYNVSPILSPIAHKGKRKVFTNKKKTSIQRLRKLKSSFTLEWRSSRTCLLSLPLGFFFSFLRQRDKIPYPINSDIRDC